MNDPSPKPEAVPDPATAAASAPAPTPDTGATVGDLQRTVLEEKIVDVLRTVYDPEIPVNIYELGLIYEIDLDPNGDVKIEMTLTSPMCPVAETLPPEVEMRVSKVEGVGKVKVNIVWEPTWSPEKMSEAAKLQLGMM